MIINLNTLLKIKSRRRRQMFFFIVCTGKQLYDSGIKPTVANASLERVKYIIEECKNAKIAAKDIVVLRLKHNIQHLNEQKADLEKALTNSLLSEVNRKTIEAKLSAVEERCQQKTNVLSAEDSPAFKAMVVRVAQNLVEQNRLKARQTGAGRPNKLDEETMEMVVQTLESDSSAERRRRDAVMYCDRGRVKESDLLDIANYYLEEQGKPAIKSSRTVALWQKPRKQSTREGQRHRQAANGRYMFTCKKPEKTLEDTHIDTHYQRAHVKMVRVAVYGDASPARSFTLDISMDDKATLKAGTDVGWQGTRGGGIFMSTEDPQQYRGHDFVGVENQLTPSAFRVMKWQVTDVNDKESLVRTYDQSFVTVRPKDKEMLGSSGAVWASEQIRLIEEHPTVFCLPSSLPSDVATFLLKVQHHCFLYSFCTSLDDEDIDLQSLTLYEEKRKDHLSNGLRDALLHFKNTGMNITELSNEVEMNALLLGVEDLLLKLTTCSIPEDSNELMALCDNICEKVKTYPNRPVPYPNMLELTDKGPGAGVHNHEVQDLFVLVCKLLESDHRMRIHRAPHDSAQNEAERTNAAIGEALATGRPVEPPADPFHGLTASQMESMTLKEV